MTMRHDVLIEILTEELPPKSLLTLVRALAIAVEERLQKANLPFEAIHFYATPRRLALVIKQLAEMTPLQQVERKGPAKQAAFDANGKPTPACLGFARSCGVTPEALQTINTLQGEWLVYTQTVPGQSMQMLLPGVIEAAALALPIQKRMRWGDHETQFVRPIKAILLMQDSEVIQATVLGIATQAKAVTQGHRFHAPNDVVVPHVKHYVDIMRQQGHVMVDFAVRRTAITEQVNTCLHQANAKYHAILNEDLLDEVTALVEWPHVLLGRFDQVFLALPREVLISSMQDHQRYFPVVDEHGALVNAFVTVSNIDSQDTARVVRGNERVLRARLSDAAFFFAEDQKISLFNRVDKLKGIVFQAKLGTLYDKSARISKMAVYLANKMRLDPTHAERAAWLSKCDLTTSMVNEFPELQGVMGGYYARHDHEPEAVALAIQEHYQPRFAGDALPDSALGQVLALADRLDTLVGTFGIQQLPTGDKDPYGLRRATLGVLRILIEKQIDLDLAEALTFIADTYAATWNSSEVVQQVLKFMQERLRAWYQDQGVSADIFAAVAAVGMTNPRDAHARVLAVQAFKRLNEATTLSVANKRVSNILAKYAEPIVATQINPAIFESPAEQVLAEQLEIKSHAVMRLYQSGAYDKVLLQLADLRLPVDNFFEQVMVMTDDKPRRENRLLLLSKLRALFLQIADIALLQ